MCMYIYIYIYMYMCIYIYIYNSLQPTVNPDDPARFQIPPQLSSGMIYVKSLSGWLETRLARITLN